MYTAAGLILVAWFVLPMSRWLFGDMSSNFSIFVLAGLAIVVGASWAIMYNADVLLAGITATAGRSTRLAPVLKMSIAYPLQNRFRTGVSLAMFTLVVFTLVCGAVTTGSFVNGVNNVKTFGGGFDVRATTSPASPIGDMRAALRHAPGVRASDITVVSNQSLLPIEAHQVGTPRQGQSRTSSTASTARSSITRAMASPRPRAGTARLPRSGAPFVRIPASPWSTRRSPLAGRTSASASTTKFRLQGFYLEDGPFAPFRVDVRDPAIRPRTFG